MPTRVFTVHNTEGFEGILALKIDNWLSELTVAKTGQSYTPKILRMAQSHPTPDQTVLTIICE